MSTRTYSPSKTQAFRNLFIREVARFVKTPYQTLATPIVSSLLYLLIFGVSLGKHIQLEGYPSYLAFLIPGLVIMSIVQNSFENASSSVIVGKYVNELQDLRIAPLSLASILWGKALSSLLRGFVVGFITYLVGFIFYYLQMHAWLSIKHPLTLLGFIFLGGISFANLGTTISMTYKSFEQINIVGTFVLLPLIYLGGVFFSLNNLHPIWQYISKFNPIFYLINGIRYGILGYSDENMFLCFGVLIIFAVLLHFLAKRSLIKGSNYYR